MISRAYRMCSWTKPILSKSISMETFSNLRVGLMQVICPTVCLCKDVCDSFQAQNKRCILPFGLDVWLKPAWRESRVNVSQLWEEGREAQMFSPVPGVQQHTCREGLGLGQQNRIGCSINKGSSLQLRNALRQETSERNWVTFEAQKRHFTSTVF